MILALAAPASAAIVLNSGSYIGGLTAVHANGAQSGTTINATAFTTGDVTFQSTSTLTTTGNGVAQIDGPFADLSFFLTAAGDGFNAANFNLFGDAINGAKGTPAFLNITAILSDHTTHSIATNFDMTQGDNKFSVTGDAGEVFSSLMFQIFTSDADTTGRPIDDIRQVEIGSVVVPTTLTAVPEPATWAMMLLGFFGLGGMLRARRRQDETSAISALA